MFSHVELEARLMRADDLRRAAREERRAREALRPSGGLARRVAGLGRWIKETSWLSL